MAKNNYTWEKRKKEVEKQKKKQEKEARKAERASDPNATSEADQAYLRDLLGLPSEDEPEASEEKAPE